MTLFNLKSIEIHIYHLRNWRKRVFDLPYFTKFAICEDDYPHYTCSHAYDLVVLGVCFQATVPLKKPRPADWKYDSMQHWPKSKIEDT